MTMMTEKVNYYMCERCGKHLYNVKEPDRKVKDHVWWCTTEQS